MVVPEKNYNADKKLREIVKSPKTKTNQKNIR